jgi:UTP--glucose-1-phosphate uridylyltransferase
LKIENSSPIRRAIIPIAGLGTRLLPLSKVIPKAMLPVHNKPSVQWIVEELNDAGINEIIFVTSKGQDMVKEYFTEHNWYDEELKRREHHDHANHLEKIRNLAKFHFVEQAEQLGDGHAVLQAKHLLEEDEPILVIFGDCLYHGKKVIKNFVQHYDNHKKSLIAVQEIDPEETHHYGIVGFNNSEEAISHQPLAISHLVEKPQAADAPSNKAIIGRYLLSPSIWKHLENNHANSGEARLIDAFQALQKEEDIHALLLDGTWLDTGSHEGLQRASDFFRSNDQ